MNKEPHAEREGEPSFQEWWDSCGYDLEGFKPARAAWNRIAEFYRGRPTMLPPSPAGPDALAVSKLIKDHLESCEHYGHRVWCKAVCGPDGENWYKHENCDCTRKDVLAAIDAAMSQQEKRDG